MKKNMVIVFLFLSANLYAQKPANDEDARVKENNQGYLSMQIFLFNSKNLDYKLNDEVKAVNASDIRRHFLGEEVAKRLYLFEKAYTYQSKPSPGSFSGKIRVEKPVIYNSINKLEKQIKKQVKRGVLSKDEGALELIKYLNTALKLFYENTADFEKALKQVDSPEYLADVFNRVEFR